MADALSGASFPACCSLMTNGASDSDDIDNLSPDARTEEKQGARHQPEKRKAPFVLLKCFDTDYTDHSK